MNTSPLVAGGEAVAVPDRRGLGTFLALWTGQVVSVLGSTMSGFALGVWVFERTGSATGYSLLILATVMPSILVAPFAGHLADHSDRRRLLMISDAGAAAGTVALVALAWAGGLQVWHVYLLAAGAACFNGLQMPAFMASVPLLVPKRHLGRTAGLTQLGQALPQVVAPFAAGVLMVAVELQGVLLVDLATFLFALVILFLVRIPGPPRPLADSGAEAGTEAGTERRAQDGRSRDLLFGWRYLRERPGMMALLLLFAGVNFCLGSVQALLAPLVLGFTDAAGLGVVLSAAGAGLVAGGLTTSLAGVPKRRVRAILASVAVQGCVLFLAAFEPSTVLVSAAAFAFVFLFPVIAGCSITLWQTKIDPAVQGRVFGFQRIVAASALPLAFLSAGPLADWVFEPRLQAGGAWADTLGNLVGTGEGRGIAAMLLGLGLLVLLTVAVASRNPRLRNLEIELPDALPEGETETTAERRRETQ